MDIITDILYNSVMLENSYNGQNHIGMTRPWKGNVIYLKC